MKILLHREANTVGNKEIARNQETLIKAISEIVHWRFPNRQKTNKTHP